MSTLSNCRQTTPLHIHEPIVPYDGAGIWVKSAGRALLNATPGQELPCSCGIWRHLYPPRNNSANHSDSPPARGYSLWCHARKLKKFRGWPWRLLCLLACCLLLGTVGLLDVLGHLWGIIYVRPIPSAVMTADEQWMKCRVRP